MMSLVKMLIWIGIFVVCLIAEIIADAIFQTVFPGYKMGYLLRLAFWGLMIIIGRKLSDRWEMRCLDKNAALEGKSRKEYLIEHTPKFIIDICEGQHTAASIQEMLKPHIKEKLINPTVAKALASEFGLK